MKTTYQLGPAHTTRIRRKRVLYWAGFLQGAISSGRITPDEKAALAAEAQAFTEFFECPDALDLISDLNAACFDSEADLIAGLKDMIDTLLPEDDEDFDDYDDHGPAKPSDHDELNRYLGLCAGVICDGIVTLDEAETLYSEYAYSDLHRNPALRRLGVTLKATLADGKLDEDEAERLQTMLTDLVGDAFSDTGVASIGLVTHTKTPLQSPDEIVFSGSDFVVTGVSASCTRNELHARIAAAGGIPKKNISQHTRYLVISDTATRSWHASHFGRKIEKAMKLVESGQTLDFVPEHILLEALDTTTG